MNNFINKLKKDSPKGLLLNLCIMFSITVLLSILFFYVYLPSVTHHKESIIVPNVIGLKQTEIEDYLKERNLRYEFIDTSSYSADYKPYDIIKQNPAPGSKVKKYRKIYLSINSPTPPKIKMPKVTGMSIKSTSLVLQSVGLKIGEIEYVPDKFKNLVLKQLYNGKEIEEGEMIIQGSTVSLVVGDGLGTAEFEIPDLIGMKKEEAELVIKGSDLKLGSVIYLKSYQPKGTILKQKPESKDHAMIHIGEEIDIWIAK